jgi:inosose dehydratase
VLNEIVETGYAGTELGDWGFMPTDPKKLSDELQSRGLALIASWVNVHMHEPSRRREDIDLAVMTARLMAEVGGATPKVVLGNDPFVDPVRTEFSGRIKPEHEMSAEQWNSFVEGAETIAKVVKEETGLSTVLHQHVGTWVETPEETRRFLENANAGLVGLCFDSGHWAFGGGDPVEGLKMWRDRIWHVHFKGYNEEVGELARREGWGAIQAWEAGVFSELEDAAIDFPALANILEETGYDGWIVVEQDVLPGMGKPKESAQRNRDYLKSIGI